MKTPLPPSPRKPSREPSSRRKPGSRVFGCSPQSGTGIPPTHSWIPAFAGMTGALLALLGTAHPAPAQQPRPADHVIFISVDGLRPEFYLEERWPAPMMQIMAREGAHARAVRGIAPTVTYPSHTSLVTGARPARHGILHNRPFEEGGPTGAWYVDASSIRVPTLWDAVRVAGLTSAGISWPVSVGAPINWNVPEAFAFGGRDGDLRGAAASTAVLRRSTTPAGLFEEMEREVIGPFPDFYWGRNLSREDLAGAMAGHLIERYRPNLLLVHLNQTDYFQHLHGREHPEVRLSVATVDRAIARMVEATRRAGIHERTTFVIVGDHGFVDVETQISPNVWLVGAGLHEDRPDRGRWRAAFHGGGGSVFLRLRDPRDRAAVDEVRRVLGALPQEVRSHFRIVERAELDQLGADPEAPLALAASPGVFLDLGTSGPVQRRGAGGAHGYFPEFDRIHTGFVAWGAGITPGASIQIMDITDIAPVAAALLRLEFTAPDGRLPPGIVR